MSDLAKRLRGLANPAEVCAQRIEAADRIEELEGMLARAIQTANNAADTALVAIKQRDELERRNAELESAIKKQAKAAIAGMDAATSHAHLTLAAATKVRAESSPEVLASERAANAALTEEVERLQAKNAEQLLALRAALDWIDAVPSGTPLPTMPGFDRDWAEGLFYPATGTDGQTQPKYDEAEFQRMVERGTKAWKDAPDNWLEDLRGNDTPATGAAEPNGGE